MPLLLFVVWLVNGTYASGNPKANGDNNFLRSARLLFFSSARHFARSDSKASFIKSSDSCAASSSRTALSNFVSIRFLPPFSVGTEILVIRCAVVPIAVMHCPSIVPQGIMLAIFAAHDRHSIHGGSIFYYLPKFFSLGILCSVSLIARAICRRVPHSLMR